MAWTEERVKKLTLLWKSGNSASKIAVELGEGVSRNAVIGKIHRLGLSERGSGLGPKGTKKSSKNQSDDLSTSDKSPNDLISELKSLTNNFHIYTYVGLISIEKLQESRAGELSTPFIWKDNETKKVVVKDGVKFIRCPQETVNTTGCNNCGGENAPLCARPYRDYIITFTAHGASPR